MLTRKFSTVVLGRVIADYKVTVMVFLSNTKTKKNKKKGNPKAEERIIE